MQVQALRGVCIGVERHLQPGDTADLDNATAAYLAAIGAVTLEVAAPVAAEPEKPRAAKAPTKEA